MVAVSQSLPFADVLDDNSLPLKVGGGDINLLAGDHRVAIVRISAPRFQALCVSIHGKDRDHRADAIKAHWKQVGDQIESCRRPDDNIICGVDGNCRIGLRNDSRDPLIGPQLDPEHRHDFVSEAFVSFARRFDLVVIATFPDLLSGGAGGTLYNKFGMALRCDYVLVSRNCLAL